MTTSLQSSAMRRRMRSMMSVLALGVVVFVSPVLLAQSTVPKPAITVEFATPQAFDVRNIRSVQACAEATRFVYDSVRQYWKSDTLYINEDRPTPPAVVQIARHCLTAFPIQTLDTLELQNIRWTAIYTGDTVPVKAVVDRILAFQTDVRARATTLMTTVNIVKKRMQPVSIPFLQSLLIRLDSLGPEARLEQAAARRAIYDSYERRGASPDSMLARAGEMLTALQRMPVGKNAQGTARGFADSVAYFQREMAWYTYLRDGTPGAFQAWRELVTRWPRGGLLGQPIPPIEGEFWIRPRTDVDTAHPQVSLVGRSPFPGQVTVVVGGGTEDDSKSPEWNLLRRIHHQFPEVKVVLLAQTAGAALGQIRLDDPAGEAALLGQIYRDSLQLPIWINVSRTVIDTSRWNSNGQPLTFNSPTYDSWRVSNQFSGIYVINRQGYVVRRISIASADPAQIFTMLERLLQLREPAMASRE